MYLQNHAAAKFTGVSWSLDEAYAQTTLEKDVSWFHVYAVGCVCHV